MAPPQVPATVDKLFQPFKSFQCVPNVLNGAKRLNGLNHLNS